MSLMTHSFLQYLLADVLQGYCIIDVSYCRQTIMPKDQLIQLTSEPSETNQWFFVRL